MLYQAYTSLVSRNCMNYRYYRNYNRRFFFGTPRFGGAKAFSRKQFGMKILISKLCKSRLYSPVANRQGIMNVSEGFHLFLFLERSEAGEEPLGSQDSHIHHHHGSVQTFRQDSRNDPRRDNTNERFVHLQIMQVCRKMQHIPPADPASCIQNLAFGSQEAKRKIDDFYPTPITIAADLSVQYFIFCAHRLGRKLGKIDTNIRTFPILTAAKGKQLLRSYFKNINSVYHVRSISKRCSRTQVTSLSNLPHNIDKKVNRGEPQFSN